MENNKGNMRKALLFVKHNVFFLWQNLWTVKLWSTKNTKVQAYYRKRSPEW